MQYFNEKLICGEDTLFMYYLISKHIRMSYTESRWYYYRRNTRGLSHSVLIGNNENYLKHIVNIRDSEYQKGHTMFALAWEGRFIYEMKRIYLKVREEKEKEKYRELKKQAIAEIKNPLFVKISLRRRILFICCIYFPELYELLKIFSHYITQLLGISVNI